MTAPSDAGYFVSTGRKRIIILAVAGLVVLSVIAVLALWALGGRGSPATGPLVPSHPGTVLLNGHSMEFGCAGSGSPTAVLEGAPGFKDPGIAAFWPMAKQLMRICVFQPSDFGRPGAPRTSMEEATQIHAILHREHILGPYVLAGIEGNDLRAFTGLYRREVGGIVFLDATYPYFPRDFLRVLGPRRPGEAAAITGVRNILTKSKGGIVRYRALSDPRIVALGGLDHVPVIVYTRGEDAVFGPDMPEPTLGKLLAVWHRGQTRLVKLSSNSREVMALQSGDTTSMLENQGDLVMFGIQLVRHAAVRAPHSLPSCVASFQPAVPSPYDQHPPFDDPSGTGKPSAECVPRGHAPSISGMPCEAETVVHHAHAHLALYVFGRQVTIPAGIGVNLRHDCLYWLHTHLPDGIIHMESPHGLPHATLGAFFQVWGQPLSHSQIWTYQVRGANRLRVYVNSKRYLGDPRAIQLHRHTAITLEIGGPFVGPKSFDFGNQ